MGGQEEDVGGGEEGRKYGKSLTFDKMANYNLDKEGVNWSTFIVF